MSDSSRITPIAISSASLAGAAAGALVGAAAKPTKELVAKKMKGTKVDAFVSRNVKKIKNVKADLSTRVKNAAKALFAKSKDAKKIKHTKGFKGFLRKANVNRKMFNKKFLNPTLKRLKNPVVALATIGAMAGAAVYTAYKNSQD